MVLKSRLESEGIKCFVRDELSSQVLSHISTITAKLQIESSDFENAKQILIETGQWVNEETVMACPNCGSENIKRDLTPTDYWKLLVAFFIALVTFVAFNSFTAKTNWECAPCKHKFRL